MAERWGTGPVFAYEWLTRCRRWQAFGLRVLFVLALLGGLGLVWRSAAEGTHLTERRRLVQAGEGFFTMLAVGQLALVLLAAPAATAGAICLDKARGTLAHVMVTDLSDAEVVLGKLAARTVPVLNLIACSLPVAALGTLLGGIDPMALTASMAIAGAVAVLGCSLSLTLSVWLTKAHEVMTVVFSIWAAWLLAWPIWVVMGTGLVAPHWFKAINPFWLALAPVTDPGATTLWEPVAFVLACLLISAGLAAVAVAKVRPVYVAQAGRTPGAARPARRFRLPFLGRPGPSLDGNPVLWREWHKALPSRWTRLGWGLYGLLSTGLSLRVLWQIWESSAGGWRGEPAMLLNTVQGGLGLLLLSASAATVLAEERARGSLDVLLATPLSTRSIVWGKWWGAFRRAPYLAFWPGVIGYSLALQSGWTWRVPFAAFLPALIVAQAAAIVSLGLALDTWISRQGRAAAWTATALVVSAIGWPILAFAVFGDTYLPWQRFFQMGMIMGSPLYSIAMTTVTLQEQTPMSDEMVRSIVVGAVLWTAGYLAIAAGLLLATLATFDRCLGRTPERPWAEPGPSDPEPARRLGRAVKGLGLRTPGAAGRPAVDAASSGPPPR